MWVSLCNAYTASKKFRSKISSVFVPETVSGGSCVFRRNLLDVQHLHDHLVSVSIVHDVLDAPDSESSTRKGHDVRRTGQRRMISFGLAQRTNRFVFPRSPLNGIASAQCQLDPDCNNIDSLALNTHLKHLFFCNRWH